MVAPKVKTEIRKEQIVTTAMNLMAEHGICEVTIARISTRLGIVPSAIYRHYKNKEKIFEAMIEYIGNQLQNNIKQTREKPTDPINQLHEILQRHIQFIRENQSIPRIIFSGDLYKYNPKHRERLYKNIQAYLNELAKLIKQGQSQNQIQKSIDPDAAALFFLGIIQPAVILWNISDGVYDITKQSEKMWTLYESILTES